MLSKYIYFSSLLKIIVILIVFIIFFIFCLQYIFDTPINANLLTYFLLFILCIFTYKLTKSSRIFLQNMINLSLAFFIIIFFLQRIIMLIINPSYFAWVQYDKILTINDLNWAVMNYCIITGIFIISIKLFSKNIKIPSIQVFNIYFKSRKLIYFLAYFIQISLILLTIKMSWKMGAEWKYGWIVRLFPVTIFPYIFACFLVDYKTLLNRAEKGIIIIFFSLNFLWGLLQGSRSGIYMLVLLFLIVFLTKYGDFKISLKSLSILFLLIIFIIIPSWFIAAHIRGTTYETEIIPFISAISQRLSGGTDNFILIINNLYYEQYKDIINWVNIIKSSINAFVPGNLFNIPFESLGSFMKILIYGDESERIHGEGWTVLGQFYIMAGYIGMYVFTFLWVMLFIKLFKFFSNTSSFLHRLIKIQLFNIFILNFFDGHNLDAIISEIMYVAFYYISFHLFLNFVYFTIKNKWKSQSCIEKF